MSGRHAAPSDLRRRWGQHGPASDGLLYSACVRLGVSARECAPGVCAHGYMSLHECVCASVCGCERECTGVLGASVRQCV